VDSQSLEDGSVTIRYRDDKRQERIAVEAAVDVVREALRTGKL
jgi:glycyl-tRNA synthetase